MKKKLVIMIHGFEGTPNGSWRPWLMEELEKNHISATSLLLPNPNNPVLSEWIQEINHAVSLFPKLHVYLVGHSLGVTAILQYLETCNPKNIKGCVLVSGPIKNEKKGLKTFFETPFNFESIKKTSKHFCVIHGDNDRFVNVAQARTLAEGLDIKPIIIKMGGHLNSYDGFMKLPQVLKFIVTS